MIKNKPMKETHQLQISDLREIASMRQNLAMTQIDVNDTKTVPSSSEMKPL